MTWAAIFQRVEPSVAAALGQRLRSMDYLPGQVIFAEGEPGDRLYAIAAGKVKIARRSPDGRQNLRTVLGPSDIFGELSVVDPGPRTSNATTLTDVRVMSMDRSELRALMADHPEITDQPLRMLARRLRRVIETQTDLVFTDVPGRLAKQLGRGVWCSAGSERSDGRGARISASAVSGRRWPSWPVRCCRW